MSIQGRILENRKTRWRYLKEMPRNVFQGGPCAWRYTDYLRIGSIYTLPDDHRLQRGPTIVVLPSGRQMKVPASHPRSVQSAGQVHDTRNAQAQMQQLLALLSGKATTPGFAPALRRRPRGVPRLGGIPSASPVLQVSRASPVPCTFSGTVRGTPIP